MSAHQVYTDEIKAHLNSFSGNIPLHRSEAKRKYSFSSAAFTEQLLIWDDVWRNNNSFYLRLHAYFFLERHLKKESELKLMWPVVVQWQEQVNDWGLCDALAKVYTKILELMPVEVYTQLESWNSDKNLWKRRQSIVSLLYYSRTKKHYLSFEQITALVSPLLDDREYYVQKAVGWSLRELNNVYAGQTMAYLKANIKQISGMALTTAMEKMSPADLSALRAARKV